MRRYGRELDAAEIRDPELRASYEACRRLNASHGKTYFLPRVVGPSRALEILLTDPNMPAEEAKAEGLAVKTGQFPFSINGRALGTNEPTEDTSRLALPNAKIIVAFFGKTQKYDALLVKFRRAGA